MKDSVYQLITGKIIMMLQQGVVPWRKPWKARTEWPRNLVSNHRYQGINVFVLHMMGYQSPYWITFNQARELGGNIRKHEKATPIILWKRIEKEDAETKEKHPVLLLRYWSVFNVTQCDGIREQPETPEGCESREHPLAAASRIVENMPNRPPIKHGFRAAYYSTVEDYVAMPGQADFIAQEEYFATLFHELGHATGHKTRLNRETLNGIHGSEPSNYPKEELCAEMTSTFLCAEAGMGERSLETPVAYIKGWLRHLKDDPKLVIHAASQGQKAADYILNRNSGENSADFSSERKEAI